MKRFPVTVAVLGSTILTFCGPFVDTAWAQSSETANPADSSQLEDIIVTAQRRSERAQSVPVAITTISPATIERQAIKSTFDLTKLVPGLNYTTNAGFAAPFIRGVGGTNAEPGDEPSVATYIDGVYTADPQGLSAPFGTVKSVEVLKGPQGTLFGRNAVGGVINVTLRGPEDAFDGTTSLSYDNYRALEGTLFVTGPLSEKVSASLDVQLRNQDRGFFTNDFNGSEAGFSNYDTFRGKLLLKPTERLTIELSADYQHLHSDLGDVTGTLPGTTPLAAYLGYPYPSERNHVYSDVPGYLDYIGWGGSATISLDLGGATLKSISSYHWNKRVTTLHVGFIPAGTLSVQQPNPGLVDSDGNAIGTKTIVPASAIYDNTSIAPYFATQEFQLASAKGGPLEWILGGFAQWSRDQWRDLQVNYQIRPAVPFVAYRNTYDGTAAYAAFAQATYHLTPQVAVVGGLRYTAETKSTVGHFFFGATPAGDNDQKTTFHDLSYHAGINFQATPTMLFYASTSRGFKSGVYVPSDFGGTPVRPEVLYAYELGAKLDITRNLRVNAAVYHYDYNNQQVNAVNSNGLSSLQNAASSKQNGAEVEIQAIPIRNLTIGLTGSYVDAHYHAFHNAQVFLPSSSGGYYQTVLDVSGKPIIQTPKWSGKASVNYLVELSDGSTVNLGASYFRTGSFSWDYSGSIKNPAYGLLDLSAEWMSSDKHYSVQLYGNNVTNTKYASGLTVLVHGALPYWGRPTVVGARFRYNFK